MGSHASFILAAYAAAIIVVALLIAWVICDYRLQLKRLAELEARGMARRTDAQS